MRHFEIGRWVLVLGMLCLFAGSALAEVEEAAGTAVQSGLQIPGSGVHNADDPGGANSPGIPSHSDDWGGNNDNPSNGNWGSGQHPNGPVAAGGVEEVLLICAALATIL